VNTVPEPAPAGGALAAAIALAGLATLGRRGEP